MMYPKNALPEAVSIARNARAKALQSNIEEIEETVRDAECSAVPVLKSLARAYRMMQRPFK